MNTRAAGLAKFVVTALVKPWDAIETIGQGGIDRLSGWVPGEPKQRYERLAQEIEQKLAQLPAHEFGGPEKLDAALSLAAALFANDGLTVDELIRQHLNRDEAIKEQRRRFDRRPESRDEPEANLCRQHVIPAIFDALFADPSSLEEIDLAFKQAVLEHLDDIRRLPEENAAALRRLAAQALVLKPYRRFDPDRLAPSALLQAEYAIVPFEGRRELLDDAIRWCAEERDLGIRLYVGPGGMGKTRFAIELCYQVTVQMPKQGWRSGFLARGFAGVPEWLLPKLRDGREPLLIVVDYAETKPHDLIQLLALAHDLPTGRKLRLLLLARSAGDWWSDLAATRGSDTDGVSDEARAKARAIVPGPGVGEPIEAGPLAAEAQERLGVFKRAFDAFKKQISHAAPLPPMPDLSGDDFRSVLMIHMAALAAVDGRSIANARELLEATLQRERVAWQRALVAPSLRMVSADDVRQAVALFTLTDGAPNRAAAAEIIARAPRLQRASWALLEDLTNVFGRLYPSARTDDQRDRPIEPLRPDLLGEELVNRALRDDPELLRAAFGGGVPGGQIQNGLTVLTRLAQRRPDAERWLKQVLAADLERLVEPAIRVADATGDPMWRQLAHRVQVADVSDHHIKAYIGTLLSGLQQSHVGRRYQALFPANHLIHPAIVQFILSTTGFVCYLVGQNLSGSPRIQIQRAEDPFQMVLFNEDITCGKPPLTIDARYIEYHHIAFAQEKAIELAHHELEGLNWFVLIGDRLIDVTHRGEVAFHNCRFYSIMRNGKYKCLHHELMFIGGNLALILSREEARSKLASLEHLLKERMNHKA